MYFHSHLPILKNDFYTNLEQTAKTVARVVVKNIPAAYELLTDKGGVFCNKLAEEIYKILGRRKIPATSTEGRINGVLKRLHRAINGLK